MSELKIVKLGDEFGGFFGKIFKNAVVDIGVEGTDFRFCKFENCVFTSEGEFTGVFGIRDCFVDHATMNGLNESKFWKCSDHENGKGKFYFNDNAVGVELSDFVESDKKICSLLGD